MEYNIKVNFGDSKTVKVYGQSRIHDQDLCGFDFLTKDPIVSDETLLATVEKEWMPYSAKEVQEELEEEYEIEDGESLICIPHPTKKLKKESNFKVKYIKKLNMQKRMAEIEQQEEEKRIEKARKLLNKEMHECIDNYLNENKYFYINFEKGENWKLIFKKVTLNWTETVRADLMRPVDRPRSENFVIAFIVHWGEAEKEYNHVSKELIEVCPKYKLVSFKHALQIINSIGK